jgi:hypothetical protein
MKEKIYLISATVLFALLGTLMLSSHAQMLQIADPNVPHSASRSTDVHIGGIYTIVAALIGIIGGFFAGRREGRKGKQKGFDNFASPLQLGGRKWTLTYTDMRGNENSGLVELDQSGCRITGVVTSQDEKREWFVEGAASGRRACYVYTDSEPNKESFGAVILEMLPSGNVMEGQWIGWNANTGELSEGKVRLEE